mmetsp:Transcript_28425/g.58265  ORF Transcript_28425/g.58265 Transcript_28425/m.58265 type:complete len:236 (+) Transcript_28425:420-1127(+)
MCMTVLTACCTRFKMVRPSLTCCPAFSYVARFSIEAETSTTQQTSTGARPSVELGTASATAAANGGAAAAAPPPFSSPLRPLIASDGTWTCTMTRCSPSTLRSSHGTIAICAGPELGSRGGWPTTSHSSCDPPPSTSSSSPQPSSRALALSTVPAAPPLSAVLTAACTTEGSSVASSRWTGTPFASKKGKTSAAYAFQTLSRRAKASACRSCGRWTRSDSGGRGAVVDEQFVIRL